MQLALEAFKTGCQAVNPLTAVQRVISLQEGYLKIGKVIYERTPEFRVILIGFGKAVIPMTVAAEKCLKSVIKDGIIIAQKIALRENKEQLDCVKIYGGATNNLPDDDSVEATRKALELIQEYDRKGTLFLFLISGGGSALFASPIYGITLKEKLDVIKLLSSHGATIQQLNSIRQRLSSVKGGKTLSQIKEAKVMSLIVSDIIDDPVHLIASGPTIRPNPVKDDPLQILLDTKTTLPKHLSSILRQPEPKIECVCEVAHQIISSNSIALEAVENYLQENGFPVICLSKALCGNARQVGEMLAELVTSSTIEKLQAKIASLFPEASTNVTGDRIALIFGGETTVILTGKGSGGRNQEICLAALLKCKERAEARSVPSFTVLSCGTDGQDGPTDAAGACFTHEALEKVDMGIAKEALEASNSYEFWRSFSNGHYHIKTGPTNTNVMDVQILMIHYNKI